MGAAASYIPVLNKRPGLLAARIPEKDHHVMYEPPVQAGPPTQLVLNGRFLNERAPAPLAYVGQSLQTAGHYPQPSAHIPAHVYWIAPQRIVEYERLLASGDLREMPYMMRGHGKEEEKEPVVVVRPGHRGAPGDGERLRLEPEHVFYYGEYNH